MLIQYKITTVTLASYPTKMHLLPDTAGTLAKNNRYSQATDKLLQSEIIMALVQ